jgi:hypothetical protein
MLPSRLSVRRDRNTGDARLGKEITDDCFRSRVVGGFSTRHGTFYPMIFRPATIFLFFASFRNKTHCQGKNQDRLNDLGKLFWRLCFKTHLIRPRAKRPEQ